MEIPEVAAGPGRSKGEGRRRTSALGERSGERAEEAAWTAGGAVHPRGGLERGVVSGPRDRLSYLSATSMIVEADGQPTPNLEAFLEVVGKQRDRDPCQLKMVALNGRALTGSIRLDLHYWPTGSLERGTDGWTRTQLSAPPQGVARFE